MPSPAPHTGDDRETPQDSRAPGAPGGAVDPQALALARTVDRTARRVAALDTSFLQLAADVSLLARHVAAATPPAAGGNDDDRGDDGDVSAVRSWLLADDAEQGAADLGDLCTWVGRVYLRYPRTDLPSCWLWHPHAVEELWWLRRAHADAYHPDTGSWLRVGDWHDRQLPSVTQRLAHAIGSCELALHLPGERAVGTPRPVPFADAAAFVAQTWTGSAGRDPGPEPTREQLSEADAYFHAMHQSGR
jgi:hypothetical protein